MSKHEDKGRAKPPAEIIHATTIESVSAGEVGRQIAAARNNPRSIDVFRERAIGFATEDGEIAASCFYAVPRAGKTIEGPSISMAEILALCYGNIRVRTRLVRRTMTEVVIEAEAWDLESNTAISAEESGRITYSNGDPYPEDLVQTTIKATAAKARRNAIIGVIPGPFVKPILKQARLVAIGNAATMADTRARAFEAMAKMGVTVDMICARLQKSASEINGDDILYLRATFAAIRDGETTVDEEFPPVEPKPGTITKRSLVVDAPPAEHVPDPISDDVPEDDDGDEGDVA